MAMNIVDNLFIDVANSDAFRNRRLKNTSATSDSLTGSYYTNDEPGKYSEIVSWFNDFDTKNTFFVDTEKTLQYVYLLEKLVIPFSKAFLEELSGIKQDILLFKASVTDKLQRIHNMTLTGNSNRYLKFDNSEPFVKGLRKIICGDITRIVIKKTGNIFYLWLELHDNYKNVLIQNGISFDQEPEPTVVVDKLVGAYNKIYYGTPGCGKSYLVKSKYELPENHVIRTTFYSDYSNSDFIGQILPKVNENKQVSYEFIPGVFALALLNAFKEPSKKVVLIIEEINRGNASAIFGDVFQLLDRDDTGESLYKINVPGLSEWLKLNDVDLSEIYLPPNLFIVATMNTSDQNVFTLDTAFKRRWKMEAVVNDFSSGLDWFDYYIPGSNIKWNQFVETINNFILQNNIMNLNNEDKRLGVYFVGKDDLSSMPNNSDATLCRAFANKVLMYIWEDVAKINRDDWFDTTRILSLDQLIEEFINSSGDESLSVFKLFN